MTAGWLMLLPGVAACAGARATSVDALCVPGQGAAEAAEASRAQDADRLPWERPPRTRADLPRTIDLAAPPPFYSRRDYSARDDPARDDPELGEPVVDAPEPAPWPDAGWLAPCGPAPSFLVPSDLPFSDERPCWDRGWGSF